MLFIGGPLNKQYIELDQNFYKYIHVQSQYDLSGFDITSYTNHYYQKEKIKGQKQTFYIMRYTEITVDKMLEILINGE